MIHLGLQLVAAQTREGDLEAYLRLGEHRHLFQEHEVGAHDVLRNHVINFGSMPAKETVETHCGALLPEASEAAAYYFEHLRRRYVADGLRSVTADVSPLLRGPGADPDAAYDLMLDRVHELGIGSRRTEVHDFREALTPVLAEQGAQTASGGDRGVRLGWDYLDAMMGGARPGDLISLAARPGEGKTWLLTYSARYAWAQHNKRSLIVTMEMPALRILQRLASMHAGVPITEVKGWPTTRGKARLRAALEEAAQHDSPLYVIDGKMAVTVDDIVLACRQLHPDIVYVDGAYLLRHQDKQLRRFERQAAVTDQLKNELATDCSVPVFSTWQFNKEVSRKRAGARKRTMDDIYGSDVIAQHSSVVLGLLEESSPETLRRRMMDILKGREGETGEFEIQWDFARMDFSQRTAEAPGPLVYLG